MTEQEMQDVLTAVVSPQRLWVELDERRRETSPPMPWWQVCVHTDLSFTQLQRMRYGAASADVRRRVTAWLRKPAPHPAETTH
ncbi:hypothetical protein ACWEU6_36215 [Streptosporangium sandarakinum]